MWANLTSSLRLTACLAFALALLSAARADDTPTAAFEQANRLYEQGKPDEAAAAYEQLLKSGRASAAVYFNLGNARFKNAQIGQAIVHYRQAARLAPRDPDIRANLQFARNSVTGGLTYTENRWRRWLTLLTLNELAGLGLLFSVAWFSLLAARHLRPAWASPLRRHAVTAGTATLLLWTALAFALHEQYGHPVAVLIARETVVHYGPFDESPAFFTVRDGAELDLQDRKDGWLQVADRSNRRGWVRRNQVVIDP